MQNIDMRACRSGDLCGTLRYDRVGMNAHPCILIELVVSYYQQR
jgi:hypothetical protein